MVLRSERLHLRNLDLKDQDEIVKLDSDPAVMKYIGDGKARERSIIVQRLKSTISSYSEHPELNVWALCLNESGAFIGWAALKSLDKSEFIEVGYRLHQNYWGHGYATEITRSLLSYGFLDLSLERIVGITHPENKASQRVLEKAGLTYVGPAFYYNSEVLLYELKCTEFNE